MLLFIPLSDEVWFKQIYRETQFIIKLPVFKERKCSYLYNNCVSLNESKNCKIFLKLHHLPDPPTVFRLNLACLSMLPFARVLSGIQKYFPKHWSINFFFYFSNRTWYFDQCAWRLHCIPYLGILSFIFYFRKSNDF